MEIAGKVAVVTGAASGIGRSTAFALAAAGVRLVIADVEAAPLDATRTALAHAGATVVARVADVSVLADVEAMRDATLAAFGAVHIVFNNAGVSTSGPIWSFSDDTWRWVLGVNLWGVIHGVRTFVPLLVEQGEGHVINTSSMQGLAPTVGGGPYAVSKTAVVALSEVLRADLAAAGSAVGVSVLCPGPVRTRIYDSDRNRPGGPADAAGRSADRVKAYLDANGVEPDAVAARVLAAIRNNSFYVLTETDRLGDVMTRATEVMEATP
jgi:NAD(P)-dependent dehydrogenase (short-subunit alcohol dehydrogenase family)